MDWLKISENTGDSWVAKHFSVARKTPSGTGAFLRFSCVKTLLTFLCEERCEESGQSGREVWDCEGLGGERARWEGVRAGSRETERWLSSEWVG